jgi:hypothetical protein
LSGKRVQNFTNFNKGLNTVASYDELDVSELITAVNVDLKSRGGFEQRKGCSIYKTLTGGASAVTRLIDYPGTPLLVTNSTLRTWESVIIATLNSGIVDYEFFTNSKLYLLDGTQYWVYDGITCSAVVAGTDADPNTMAGVRRCKKLLQRGQRMFAIGDPQNPNSMYFSEVGDPTVFKASSVVNAVTDDTDGLIGLTLFSDSLLAFKSRNIFRWAGWDPTKTVTFLKMDTGHGAVSSDSICISDDYLIFAGKDGIFCLSRQDTDLIKSYCVSRNIEDFYNTLTNKDKMVAIVYKNNYYLACCDDGTGRNNLVLKASLGMPFNGSTDEGVSTLLFPWVVYRGWNVGAWMVVDDTLYFGSSVAGLIYQAFNTMNDNGVPVSSEITYYLKIGDPVVSKKLKDLFLVTGQSEDFNCSRIQVDVEAGYEVFTKYVSIDESALWDSSLWDETLWDWAGTIIKDISIGRKVTRLKVKLSHNKVDEGMLIYGFAAYYKNKKPKGVKTGVTDF